MKADDLCDRILASHPTPEWACFFEVRSSSGWNQRSADAIAMNLWESRGLTLRGFEIKVSRQDLKTELRSPKKAEAIAKYCDEWWLVTPQNLVRDEGFELPAGWGLMEANDKGGLRTVRKAPHRETIAPLTKGFVAQVLKHAQTMVASENAGWVRRESITDELEKARQNGMALIPFEAQRHKSHEESLMKILKEFQEGTGINLEGDWKNPISRVTLAYRIGMAILGEYGNSLEQIVRSLENVKDLSRECIKTLKPLVETTSKLEK